MFGLSLKAEAHKFVIYCGNVQCFWNQGNILCNSSNKIGEKVEAEIWVELDARKGAMEVAVL